MSDATAQLKSINCTNCGAGLPVLGGGRVTTQICGYCGASLDATDNFRVLDVYAGMERPPTPFQLGMTGTIDGVEFTITGIKGMREPGYGEWVDHMLFSPTHGYAWLTLENGHLVFTRKMREQPDRWLSSNQVESAEIKPSRRFQGATYTYYETTDWIVDFVEGAFNYRPKKDDRGTTVTLANWSTPKAKFLSLIQPRKGAGEREVEVSEYAADAAEAFGVSLPEARSNHPLKPYDAGGNRFYTWWFGGMVAASFVLLFVILGARGGYERLISAQMAELPAAVAFNVSDTSRPVDIRLVTDTDNSWVEFPMRVFGPDGQPVVDRFMPISYYYGSSGGESWSEGSRTARVSFLPPVAGSYRLELDRPEGEAITQNRITFARVENRQSIMTIRWPILAIVLFTLIFVYSLTRRLRFQLRRASGSDWTEEDD